MKNATTPEGGIIWYLEKMTEEYTHERSQYITITTQIIAYSNEISIERGTQALAEDKTKMLGNDDRE
jgi:hypothetical protein